MTDDPTQRHAIPAEPAGRARPTPGHPDGGGRILARRRQRTSSPRRLDARPEWTRSLDGPTPADP